MKSGNQQDSYIEGVHRFIFDPGYEVCRIECSSFYSRQTQNFCGGSKEVDFMLYHPGKRELWLIEVKDYRFDARPKVRELIHILARKVKDSLFLLRVAAMCSPDEIPLEGMALREFARASSDAVTVRLAFLLELNSNPLFPEGAMLANINNLLMGQMRFIDPNLVCAPVTYPGRIGPWQTRPADGQVSKRVEARKTKKQGKAQNAGIKQPAALVVESEQEPLPAPAWKKRARKRIEGKKSGRQGRQH